MSFARPVVASARQFDIAAGIGQVQFTFPAPLFDPADLVVLVKVAPLGFLPAANVAVTLSPGLDQGTVLFAVAPRAALGAIVTVRLSGQRVQSRLSDVTRGGTFIARALEDELDRQAIILQELRRDISAAVAQQLLGPTSARALAAAPLSPAGVRRGAFLMALEATVPGAYVRVANNLPDAPNGPVALGFADPFVEPGSAYYLWVQATLGLTVAQMAGVLLAAGGLIDFAGLPIDGTALLPLLVGQVLAALVALPSDQPALPGQLWWNQGLLCRT